MPCLAAIAMVVFFYMHDCFQVQGIPMPVIIETGRVYTYSEIYSSITVPLNWSGDCYSQRMFVKYYAEYYNDQLRGVQKKGKTELMHIENGWKCVE